MDKKLKDPSETPFLVASISSASFSRLPAKVEDFNFALFQMMTIAMLGKNCLTCRSFYKELMGSSLAAIQLVIIKQMCRMATVMWDGVSRSMADGRSTDLNNRHIATHRISSRGGSVANETFADIGTSHDGDNCHDLCKAMMATSNIYSNQEMQSPCLSV